MPSIYKTVHPSTTVVLLLAVVIVLASCRVPNSLVAAESPTLTDHLKGVDLQGRVHQVHDSAAPRAVIFVFLSIDCPISNGYLPGLNRLAARHRGKPLAVYGVISDPLVTRTRAVEHSAEYQIRFPVLFDASGELQRRLAPSHTPHAFVVDGQQRVVYEGAIDNKHASVGSRRTRATQLFLQDAILAVQTGQQVEVASTTPVGCRIEPAVDKSSQGDVTYTRDIAPIINANCTGCHRPDQTAPFSLLNYEDVSRHARQITEVTQSRLMPPWKPAQDFGHFRDERRLSDDEIALLDVWSRSGKPIGDPADLPTTRNFPAGWRLGEPDLVLEMNDVFDVPADGPDIHQYFVLPTQLRTDRLIAAIEFQPGARSVVHHAAFFLDNRKVARRLDAQDPDPGYRGFGGPGFLHQGTLRSWLPGMSPRSLPAGTGRLIPRHSDIVVEVHYHCSGKAERDQFKVGIHFAPPSAKQIVIELQVLNKQLKIPARERRHHHQASYVLPVKTTLLDVVPHMHLLGREMKVTAVMPGGDIEPLVWVKDWDFNWQGQYTYITPVTLPQGTQLLVDAWYDNSEGNVQNPNTPPRDVFWGAESTDEMDICHFHCTCESLKDLKTLLAHHDRFGLLQKRMQQKSQVGRPRQ